MSNKKLFLDSWTKRGVENIYPNEEEFNDFLKKGEKLDIFLGIDPTGPTLHIGHGTILLKLKKIQEEGHKVRILIGDFTARIGDPTDKTSTRVKLSVEEIKNNYKNYKEQIARVLDLDKTEFVFNNDWLGKMSFADVLELTSEFTVAQMIERDMFQERIKNEEPIYIHEFLYPLMQGYDSVAMGVNAEIGANDQTFNMLTGRTMMKKRGLEKFVIATKLLVDPTGKKMGKTEGNMVTFDDSPSIMYGKVMSWPDSLMPLAYEICTEMPLSEVEEILKGHPRDAKMRLAREIVKIFNDSSRVEEAENDFIKKFQSQEIPENIKEIEVGKGALLKSILVEKGIVESNLEFRRLRLGNALTILPTQEKIIEPSFMVQENLTLRIGKKTFVKISVK